MHSCSPTTILYLININLASLKTKVLHMQSSSWSLIFMTINVDKKDITQLLYIDYRKAFDTIDHGLLLKKLKAYSNVDETAVR